MIINLFHYFSICYCLKLLEPMILNKLEVTINDYTTIDRAGFRSNRGCIEQPLALTTFIENGFQKGFPCFIDIKNYHNKISYNNLGYQS